MKYLKIFEDFQSRYTWQSNSELKKKIEKELLDKWNINIENFTINNDLTVDVDGDVNLYDRTITKLPFKFGKVTGNFSISESRLETLEGCPYEIGGNFNCWDCNLTSLEFSPLEIGAYMDCSGNKLTSLKGMPLEIGSDFDCYHNKIKELDSVSNIEGYINCDEDVDITKFQGYCKGIKLHES